MKQTLAFMSLATILIAGAVPSNAADKALPPVVAKPGEVDFHRWIVRLRATGVWSGRAKSIWAGGVLVPGAEANVSHNILPELDVSYFLTRDIALSFNATASRHTITGAGTIEGLGVLGRATVMAPALTVQYHLPGLGAFKPYVGVGGTQAFYFNQKDGALTNFKIRNAPGAVFQLGLDWMVTQHWGINIDVKKYLLQPSSTGSLGPIPVNTKIRSDPWLAGIGIAARF